MFIAEQMLSRLLSKRTGHIATLQKGAFLWKEVWLRFWAEMTFGVGMGQQGKMRGGPGWQWEGRGMVLRSES